MDSERDVVLSYPPLKKRIESRDRPEEEKKAVLANLKKIRADVSLKSIGFVEKLFDFFLGRLYNGIFLDDALADAGKIAQDNHVVLVPNHQSHADYITINYIFYKTYKKLLYTAGGNNLNIFPIGLFFRRLGCFFIRRTLSGDITYKLTLEAYLYFLLKRGRVVEFFFEGGRSRTGKLLAPRYGLYNMLTEAYFELAKTRSKKLVFVPVSIVHEYVPETKALRKELDGRRKKKESVGQLLGLVKLFSRHLGSVHIRFGRPIVWDGRTHTREGTQALAFDCFREVGKNMMVTPASLLALVLLDEPGRVVLWRDVLRRSLAIVRHCRKFGISHSSSLQEDIEAGLKQAVRAFVGNKCLNVVGRRQDRAYFIRLDRRHEILYHKNTILHHFLVPYILNCAWIKLFSGQVQSVEDLKNFLLQQRRQLKHEFYLPSAKQFFSCAFEIIGDVVGREVSNLEQWTAFSKRDLYAMASQLGVFSCALSHINEAYFVSGLTLKALGERHPEGVRAELYAKGFREVFSREFKLGRIHYPEGCSTPLIRSSLKYFIHQKLVNSQRGMLKVVDRAQLEQRVACYERDLIDQSNFNIRVPH